MLWCFAEVQDARVSITAKIVAVRQRKFVRALVGDSAFEKRLIDTPIGNIAPRQGIQYNDDVVATVESVDMEIKQR